MFWEFRAHVLVPPQLLFFIVGSVDEVRGQEARLADGGPVLVVLGLRGTER